MSSSVALSVRLPLWRFPCKLRSGPRTRPDYLATGLNRLCLENDTLPRDEAARAGVMLGLRDTTSWRPGSRWSRRAGMMIALLMQGVPQAGRVQRRQQQAVRLYLNGRWHIAPTPQPVQQLFIRGSGRLFGVPAGRRVRCLWRSGHAVPVRPSGLDQHVQGRAQVSVGVDDVGAGPGVIAALLGPFRHRSERLPGRNERGLQADTRPVTAVRAQTRSPNRGPPGGYRTRPLVSERGTARAGSRFR